MRRKMIKRWKVVECNWCHKMVPMEKVEDRGGSWFELPCGWKRLDRKMHLCQTCKNAMYRVRFGLEPKGEDADD